MFKNLTKINHFIVFSLILFAALTFGAGLGSTAGQSRQLSLADILIALRSKKAEIIEKNRILTEAVQDRGITFSLTPEIEKELSGTGAYPDLLNAIRAKASTPVETVAERRSETKKVDIPDPKPVPPAPDFAFYRNRANKELADGNLDSAIADLGKAIEMKPADVGAYLARGFAVLKQDRSDAALKDLDKVIELDPKNSTAYFVRAQIAENLGQTDKARVDYNKAAEIDPANTDAVASVERLRPPVSPASLKIVDPPPVKAEPISEPRIMAVGALNNYATKLEIPKYSTIDRKMGYQGKVTVQIVLDENGKVVSAVASDGPQSLRRAAEEAARRSTFRPVKNGEQGTTVSGFIAYNFVPNQ